MPITTVSYSKKFTIGPYLTESIGAEITLGENQDPLEALAEIHKLCDEFHIQANPHLQAQEIHYSPPLGAQTFSAISKEPAVEVTINEDARTKPTVTEVIEQYKQYIVDIQNCNDSVVLGTYWLLAKKYPEIKDAYEAKKKELDAITKKDILDRTEALIQKNKKPLK